MNTFKNFFYRGELDESFGALKDIPRGLLKTITGWTKMGGPGSDFVKLGNFSISEKTRKANKISKYIKAAREQKLNVATFLVKTAEGEYFAAIDFETGYGRGRYNMTYASGEGAGLEKTKYPTSAQRRRGIRSSHRYLSKDLTMEELTRMLPEGQFEFWAITKDEERARQREVRKNSIGKDELKDIKQAVRIKLVKGKIEPIANELRKELNTLVDNFLQDFDKALKDNLEGKATPAPTFELGNLDQRFNELRALLSSSADIVKKGLFQKSWLNNKSERTWDYKYFQETIDRIKGK